LGIRGRSTFGKLFLGNKQSADLFIDPKTDAICSVGIKLTNYKNVPFVFYKGVDGDPKSFF
jgi:hypothetical protein